MSILHYFIESSVFVEFLVIVKLFIDKIRLKTRPLSHLTTHQVQLQRLNTILNGSLLKRNSDKSNESTAN